MTTQRSNFVRILLGSAGLAALMAGHPVLAADADTLKRLEALEQRIQQLESRNKDLETKNRTLEDAVEFNGQRLQATELRAGSIVKPDVSPIFGDPNGNFTFKVRGVAQADFVKFNERNGGYNYNSGTGFRRARLGAEGDAFKVLKWRFETDFAGNAVVIQDAYVAYAGIPNWTFTLGQQKVPFGLESNNSDSYNVFIERGVANNAFSAITAERRIGAHVLYAKNPFTFGLAVTGDNESSLRADTAAREGVGVNTRATWEPIYDAELRKVLHFGVAGVWRTDLKQVNGATTNPNAVRFNDRPNVRVDGGNIADTGVIQNVRNLYYYGGEIAGVYQSFWVQGEYGRVTLDRDLAALSNITFDGGYAAGGWFLTGESKPYRNGLADRLRPAANFNPTEGKWGALELAFRYDWFDFANTPVAARAGNKGDSTTAALNWYLNPNVKILLNWVRFAGTNTPLDPVGASTAGDAYAARLHIDW